MFQEPSAAFTEVIYAIFVLVWDFFVFISCCNFLVLSNLFFSFPYFSFSFLLTKITRCSTRSLRDLSPPLYLYFPGKVNCKKMKSHHKYVIKLRRWSEAGISSLWRCFLIRPTASDHIGLHRRKWEFHSSPIHWTKSNFIEHSQYHIGPPKWAEQVLKLFDY